jgi:hypothetical protein
MIDPPLTIIMLYGPGGKSFLETFVVQLVTLYFFCLH